MNDEYHKYNTTRMFCLCKYATTIFGNTIIPNLIVVDVYEKLIIQKLIIKT